MPVEESGETTMEAGRPPTPVLPGLWVFAPNRDSMGGTSWLLAPRDQAPLLIDMPAYTAANLAALRGAGGGMILLTSREGHGRCRRWQEALGWPVRVQEQEAYLLPGVAELAPFGDELDLGGGLRALWTPGPTPGACVVHAAGELDVLFCGRLLVPTARGRPVRCARPALFTGTGSGAASKPCTAGCRPVLPAGSPAERVWGHCKGRS